MYVYKTAQVREQKKKAERRHLNVQDRFDIY